MGRTRSFAEQDAARAALGVFWDRGYAETAVPDLERATGLSRSSIYHSFGSKRGLFDAAVVRYLDDVVHPRLAGLQSDTVEPGALETYLKGLRSAMADTSTPLAAHGCLLVNTAAASTGDDADLRAAVRAYRQELSAAVHAGALARRPELDDKAATTLATACLAHIVAAMALVRADPDAAVALIDNSLALVRDRPRPSPDESGRAKHP